MYSLDPTLQGYEENLSKFKDERDAVQKKTFTKWVNKHLRKIGRRVDNLFEDLRDGHNLVSLLEVLSGDSLPRERGLTRFHMLQNVQTSLDYLRYRKIKLVNIRAEDIVDSNAKLTLGLIWTIILHFQISDIMVGQDESLTAREALLRWSQRTTAKYPGVRVKNFTSCWKDGLAFNAIIHRTRPDLVDWRSLKTSDIRERLESAFSTAEREYGVTRLLDPEDVDTPEPDEKSLITYISSLYDAFPHPPALHPLYDPETQKKYGDYRELLSSFNGWIRESTLLMEDRNFPNTLMEVKNLALESKRFRTDEVPRRLREKENITRLYNDIEKFLEETEEILEPELRLDTLERNWSQLLLLQQERDDAIHREIERLEGLQRIAEKVHREAKQFDIQLDDVETRIDEEAKRIDRLLVGDAVKNCEILSGELDAIEDAIKNMFADVKALKDGSYNQAGDLNKRVQRIHHCWELIRAVFQTRLLNVLPSLTSSDFEKSSNSSLEVRLMEINEHFHFLRESLEWVQSQSNQMDKAAYGTDLSSVDVELNLHLEKHQAVDEFQCNVETCIMNRNKFQGEELVIYDNHLAVLQQSYTELTMASKNRLSDLQRLQEFMQLAMTELTWLNEKEKIEITRDWSSKLLNLVDIQSYYKELMSDLEKREIQMSVVQSRGEALVQHHPAFECVEAHMMILSSKWKWLLKLTLCLETHLRHAVFYDNFFAEVKKCEEWCTRQDQLLNSTYSQSGFTLDEGEKLLKEMQDLRDELSHYSKVIEALCESSLEVVPLKQRGSSLSKPIAVKCICSYKEDEVTINKDEMFELVNNLSVMKWKVVSSNGVEYQVPSVCLMIPPPDSEAIEVAERLKRQYYHCEALWIKKQMRMSQNMIFATIKVVKSWDVSQFMSVGKDQRDAILRALNEDTEKLLQQGDPSDPQLRCLQRKIEEVNQLFCEFERRETSGNRPELSQLAIDDQLTSLQIKLEEFETTLISRITVPLPRDLDQLEQFVVDQRRFETDLQSLQLELDSVKENVEACQCKTPPMQASLDTCNTQWKKIWENSNLYVERLKGSEIVLNGLDVLTKFVSHLEIQLVSWKNTPSDAEALSEIHDDLIDMQSSIQTHQSTSDQLVEEASAVRRLVIRSRNSVNTTIRKHPDVDRLEAEINAINSRLNNICTQVDERLHFCESLFEHQKTSAVLQVDETKIDSTFETSNEMPSIMNGNKSSLSMPSIPDVDEENANYEFPEKQPEVEQHLRELPCLDLDDRMDALKKAMAIVKEFQDKFFPIANWLDEMERQIRDTVVVATDEEKIQQSIEEHDLLHDDILRRKPDLESLANNFTDLMSLVVEEEAAVLADRLAELTDRYAVLVEDSDALGQLLDKAKSSLRRLVLSYEDLMNWMESLESKLKNCTLAVHVEKLQEQMKELMRLTEEVARYQDEVESVVDIGLELMRHITDEEALQLKEKLGFVQHRYIELSVRADELLKEAQEIQPVVEQFHLSHNRLANYLLDAEDRLQALDFSSAASGGSAGLHVQESIIIRLEKLLTEVRPFLDIVNESGPQLCQRCPVEGAAYIESLITRDNRRFDAVHEQMQRKIKRLQAWKQRLGEVVGDLDQLLDWFREMEQQIREAEPPSCDPGIIRVQLTEHKSLGEEISSQKGRVRDVLSASQAVLRQSPQTEDSVFIREKMEDLKEIRDHVSELNADRLSILEQAIHSSKHFHEAHSQLSNWLDEREEALANVDDPAIHLKEIGRQQEVNKLLMSEVAEYKPILEKLNKTGTALAKLCLEEDGLKIHDIIELDNARYAALRSAVRQRQKTLDDALQETSQFSDKLEGMLTALGNAFEQVKLVEPVSVYPDKIQEQMQENQSIIEDLEKRESAFEAVKLIGDEVLMKNPSDPAMKDITCKLKKLSKLWDTVTSATEEREKSLEEALVLSKQFWEELQVVMTAVKELQGTLVTQEPPAVEPTKIHQQQVTLQDIKSDIGQIQPKVEHCQKIGQELIELCGEPDKPEVRKHTEELESAWDNVTALYTKREENLIEAMGRAIEYHDILNALVEFLEKAGEKFQGMRPLGTDIETVKKQIEQLQAFKAEVDPHVVTVETLNRQASDLILRTSPDQAGRLKDPLAKVNRCWEDLLRGVVDMQRELENALLHLGQFQHALNELLVWIQRTESTLNELKPVHGDPIIIEVELAKLKLFVNDIQAHQTTVDTLNDASRQLAETDKSSDDPNNIQKRLVLLNQKWGDMVEKASNRQQELENALKESEQFIGEIQDLLLWLNDIDGALSMSKPVGGLPETASDQLQLFLEVYHELEKNLQLVESCLDRGTDYLNQSSDRAAPSLQRNLRMLKQRWDNSMNRANDKKIKLETALKEATEFHDALQVFIEWLTNAEKTLSALNPVSRVMETVLSQIEDHKSLQKDISIQREAILSLNKKGTNSKYFSQKQDVILIKNLLISVQHRWERVLSRAAERTRALDHGYKEAKEYHDPWHELYSWLEDAEKGFNDAEIKYNKDPEKIKQLLAKHTEFHEILRGKKNKYDGVVRLGKLIKDRAPKTDNSTLKLMESDMKAKWQSVCNKSIDRQRKLEEGLLFSGQFEDAIKALVDWLCKADRIQLTEGPVHGDLDTVMALREQHNNFEEELHNKFTQAEAVQKMAVDVMAIASDEDKTAIQRQVSELEVTLGNVSEASNTRSARLDDALIQSETLDKSVSMLLECFSDALTKLRFTGVLPDEESGALQQLADHHKYLEVVIKKEADKDDIMTLAQDILEKAHPDAVTVIQSLCHVIQSRWEEVMTWASQREQRLNEHLRNLREMTSILEELFAWLSIAEKTLVTLEAEPLPDDLAILEVLVKDHQDFMEDMAKRQPEMDRFCRTKTPDRENSLIPRLLRSSCKPPSGESTPGPQQQTRRTRKVNLEGSPCNPRARHLWDRWRNVWMIAWERQRCLQDKLNYLQEIEKVKNFSWDDWRRRFMKYMNNKKSRVTDLFRRLDKSNEGFISCEDFIDGIMKTKFPSSRIEMNVVANMFDRNNEAFIEWKEFLTALRPDWEERRSTEDEIIQDEVERAVNQCTCRSAFKVHQVSEGQYRFGENQKLRLVRILRSTVMVRVGGGWEALGEFLVKNDPCRAKGKTNFELREQFLPEGASQGMTLFKSRASPNSSVSSQLGNSQTIFSPLHSPSSPLSTAGLITKVREKAVLRSTDSPLLQPFSVGTPDTSVSESDGSFHIGHKASALRKSMTSGSYSGSRSTSRLLDSKNRSIQSLDSYDGGSVQNTPISGSRRSLKQPSWSCTLPRKRSAIPSLSLVGTRARHPSGSRSSGVSPSLSGDLNGVAISAASRSRILRTASTSSIPTLTSTPARDRISSGSNSICNLDTPGTIKREGKADVLTAVVRKVASTDIRKKPLSTFRPSPNQINTTTEIESE